MTPGCFRRVTATPARTACPRANGTQASPPRAGMTVGEIDGCERLRPESAIGQRRAPGYDRV